jgi:hypothetical protein
MRTTNTLVAVCFVLTGCTTHNRISGGSTFNTESSSFGGEGTLTGATGEDVMLVASATARGGHHKNGSSLLFGIEVGQIGSRFGGRISTLAGPAFVGVDDEIDVTAEVRAGVSVFRMFDTESSRYETLAKRTVGLELFVSNIGLDGSGTMIGLALSIGRLSVDSVQGFAASPPDRTER